MFNMGREDKKEPFLSNLGRATMRGLKKCQKCGTMNGTRGYSCKNKSCDVVFKEAGYKKKGASEPCKINTGSGSSIQIFSVRARDKGPDYRGFVKLPNECGNILLNQRFLDFDSLAEAGAKCYVDCCIKANKFDLARSPIVCSHIKSATMCLKDSEPLTLVNSIINQLPIPQDYIEEMCLLAKSTPGPLVQRVSKNIVVVKCKPDTLHPFGFLHFSFSLSKAKKDGDLKFFCSCRNFKLHSYPKESSFRKCVHLYACVAAFASNEKLANEFSFYIDLIQNKNSSVSRITNKDDIDEQISDSEEEEESSIHEVESSSKGLEEVSERSFLILNDSETGTPCQVEVEILRDEDALKVPIGASQTIGPEDDIDSKLEIQLQADDGLHFGTPDGGTISVHQIPENIPVLRLKRKQEESVVQASSALLNLQKSPSRKKHYGDLDRSDDLSLPYISWLASVTERINQSMHYGFCGKPEPLVFHIPKTFFDRFIESMNKNVGFIKRKIIPEPQTFIRKDAVPLGEFTKFTWKLYSMQQVQEMFENPEIPLEINRYFSHQKDGTYKLFPSYPISIKNEGISCSGQLIRPHVYKTTLKVAPACVLLHKDPTPFIIEWIPDILPATQIGELRVKFEFDQYCDKQLVMNKPIVVSPVSIPRTVVKTVRVSGPPTLAPRPPANKFSFPFQGNDNLLSFPISADSLSMGESITLLTF